MKLPENMWINDNGNLMMSKTDTTMLARDFKTPLYVFDEEMIRKNCRMYKDAIDKYYNGNGLALYASKAFCSMAICKIVDEEGLGIDVVSGGELYTAIKAGFPMNKVYFHGNNKTYDEIKLAVANNVSHIIVDNSYELKMINEISTDLGKTTKILFRIKPGIDAHTHDFIRTGQIDSKFGVALENGEAFEIVKEAMNYKNVVVDGVHCHIGSQIFDIEPFCLAAEVMMNFMADVHDKLGLTLSQLNLGGGFGMRYTEDDDPIPYSEYVKSVSDVVRKTAQKRNIAVPFILMEPGRSIVGPAGITLYTVGGIKDIKNVRKYISVDGGMGDNPRYILYGSRYSAIVANNANEKEMEKVTVAGKCCESGDLVMENEILPKMNVGDTLAVFGTGAYNYSMASNYNRIPRPAVVLVNGESARVIVKRESYDDIISNDIV